jgi:pilus assembly protein CpaF
VNLTEVPAVEEDTIILRDIFLYQEGKEKQEKSPGLLQPTGIKPQFIDRIEALSISLPTEMFLAP